MRNRLAALLAAAALVAPAHAYAQDTAAVEVNTEDGSSVFDFAFAVHRAASHVVDNGNAAVAYASCEDCQTIAISIQVVLVFGDPNVVSPENVALAVNQDCTLCATLAAAYQYVIGTGGPARFTAEGNRRLAMLRLRLLELSKARLPLDQVIAELKEIVAELKDILATELVPAGPPAADGSPSPAPTGEPTGDATSEPTGEPTGDATSEPAGEPSESATPSPSGTATP